MGWLRRYLSTGRTNRGTVPGAVVEPPTNTVAPSVSGVPVTGQTLTAADGTWTGGPTFTYQWKRAGVDISGATASTYQPVQADEGSALTVAVTGTNAGGSATATSAATDTIYPAASANYTTGRGAVSDGQYFAAVDTTTRRKNVWLRDAGAGVLVAVTPIDSERVTADTQRAAVKALPFASQPDVDFDSVRTFYGAREFADATDALTAPTLNVMMADAGSLAGWFLTNSPTVTLGAADSGGGSTGFRLQVAAGSSRRREQFVSIPPGRWVLKFEARKTGGSATSSDLGFGTNNTTGLQTAAVTTSWQTFAGTAFELTAETANRRITFGNPEGASNAAAALDVEISNVRLIPDRSGVDYTDITSVPAIAAHYLRVMNWSGNVLRSATGGSTYAGNQLTTRFRSARNVSDWTYCALMSVGDLVTTATFMRFVTPGGSTRCIGEALTVNSSQNLRYIFDNSNSLMMTMQGAGWVVACYVVSGTTTKLFVNGVYIRSFTTSSGLALSNSRTLTHLASEHWSGGETQRCAGDFGGWAWWPSALSDADAVAASAVMASRAAAKGVTLQALDNVLVYEGDSITKAVGDLTLGGYAHRAACVHAGVRFPYLNLSSSASTLRGASPANSFEARFPALSAEVLRLVAAGVPRVIVSMMFGANDSAGGDLDTQAQVEQYYADSQTWWAAVRAIDPAVRLIVGTPTAFTTETVYDSTEFIVSTGPYADCYGTYAGTRGYLRALLLRDDTLYHACADFGGHADLVPWSADNYSDEVHENALGHSKMAVLQAAAIDAVEL